jgi:hypothetical protein
MLSQIIDFKVRNETLKSLPAAGRQIPNSKLRTRIRYPGSRINIISDIN